MIPTSPVQKRLINFELACAIGHGEKRKKKLGCRPEAPGWISRMLKNYDSELQIWFNRVWGKWMIFRRGHAVMTVQNEDRSYRPLDQRTFYALRKADCWARGKKILDEMIEHNEAVEAKDDADFRDNVRYASKDLSKTLNRVTTDIGARNMPKEDYRIPDDLETLEARRSKRNAGYSKDYFKREVA